VFVFSDDNYFSSAAPRSAVQDGEVGELLAAALPRLLIYGEKFMPRRHCIQMSGDPVETRVRHPRLCRVPVPSARLKKGNDVGNRARATRWSRRRDARPRRLRLRHCDVAFTEPVDRRHTLDIRPA